MERTRNSRQQLLDHDDDTIETVIDHARVEAAAVGQVDRLRVGDVAAGHHGIADSQCRSDGDDAARRRVLVRVQCDGIVSVKHLGRLNAGCYVLDNDKDIGAGENLVRKWKYRGHAIAGEWPGSSGAGADSHRGRSWKAALS